MCGIFLLLLSFLCLKESLLENYQKIELYGSLTTKELKKKHSSRLVGGVEMGNQGIEDERQCGSWWTGWTNIRMQIN